MNARKSWHEDSAKTSSHHPPKRQKTHQEDLNARVPGWGSGRPCNSHCQYTIAWICALHIEVAAARAMLDQIHPDLPRDTHDTNTYTLGSVGHHNVVIACLPVDQYGTNNAATVLTHLVRTFPEIRLGLMVGIGGGVPDEAEVRLGDVVVGTSVIQHDLGKIVEDGLQSNARPKCPPPVLSTAVASLRAQHDGGSSRIPFILRERFEGQPEYGRPTSPDHLFLPTYNHISQGPGCQECDHSRLVSRESRSTDDPFIHYGRIASGNQVMRSGTQRVKLAAKLGVICFEMEAAGLMDILPCLPIRGICDYSDSHKNKEWQRYAAATAAAYAKEFLSVLPVTQVRAQAPYVPNVSPDSFRVPFSLQGVPASDNFVDRPSDRAALEQCLLPQQSRSDRRKLFVLYGLGGIGKTQLAIDFSRRHKADFSAVFWLDGRSEDQLKQSLAKCATRIPELRGTSRNPGIVVHNEATLDAAVMNFMEWLAQPDNTRWLLIFDNVDQDHEQGGQTGAYDLRQYLPGDHGSVLVTTRLSRLQQLGKSRHLTKVDSVLSKAILETWYGGNLDSETDYETLFELMQGLPLALAQAGSYLRETGMEIATYTQIYNQQWQMLMSSDDNPLTDYQGSIATTWTISLKEIERQSSDSINLLRLWAFLDNKKFWRGIFLGATAPFFSGFSWPTWLLGMAQDEARFAKGMSFLVRYSMIETEQEPKGSYTMHPVVHQWLLHLDSNEQSMEFARLALFLVGYLVPRRDDEDYWVLLKRLLPHAERCSQWVRRHTFKLNENTIDARITVKSICELGSLFYELSMLLMAKEMYDRALEAYENTVEDYREMLKVVRNLGRIFRRQGMPRKAEEMFRRVLQESERTLGRGDNITLNTLNDIGLVLKDQGKLREAEQMCNRALKEDEIIHGHDSPGTLIVAINLGELFLQQGRIDEAEEMCGRALKGSEKSLGCYHRDTLLAAQNLGVVFLEQGRLDEAERMCDRALKGYELHLGHDHRLIFMACVALGNIYRHQGKFEQAEQMLDRALQGFDKMFGPDHHLTLLAVDCLGRLYGDQDRLRDAEEMFGRALKGSETVLGRDHITTLWSARHLGILYKNQGKLLQAGEMLTRVLEGFKSVLGPTNPQVHDVARDLQGLLSFTDQT
ncbi:hypothetical protein FDECE_2959 [Fusarium decemcellulare]|nr:hypothetical protein FDECE_2959 [Fusarium decemcellulare]